MMTWVMVKTSSGNQRTGRASSGVKKSQDISLLAYLDQRYRAQQSRSLVTKKGKNQIEPSSRRADIKSQSSPTNPFRKLSNVARDAN